MLVSALVRRVGDAGGAAAVLAKGDPQAGSILLICCEKGEVQSLRERLLTVSGGYAWAAIGPESAAERDSYLQRRQAHDRDLWLVELDIADAERFAAETSGDV